MTDDELRINLFNSHQESKDKYIYFLLSLDVACFGFSITQIKSFQWNEQAIPLLIALVMWAISFFSGFYNRKIDSGLRATNAHMIQMKSLEKVELTEILFNKYNSFKAKSEKEVKDKSKLNALLINLQILAFSLGIVSFFIWHLMKVYKA